nr:hypothetical protein [Tanacetum cinerariifolium]
VKDKPQVGSLSPRKWRTRDMIVVAKHGDKMLNVKDKASVKVPADVVEKPDKVKDKTTVKKPITVMVKDKSTVKKPAVVATVKKPTNVVEKPDVLVKECFQLQIHLREALVDQRT